MAGIVATKISDHLPIFMNINFDFQAKSTPKYVKIRKGGDEAMNNFKSEIHNHIGNTNFDNNLFAVPNDN